MSECKDTLCKWKWTNPPSQQREPKRHRKRKKERKKERTNTTTNNQHTTHKNYTELSCENNNVNSNSNNLQLQLACSLLSLFNLVHCTTTPFQHHFNIQSQARHGLLWLLFACCYKQYIPRVTISYLHSIATPCLLNTVYIFQLLCSTTCT